MRLLRRSEKSDEAPAEPTPLDPQMQELADFTERLLADVLTEEEERLAEGVVLTKPHDLAYMRVTDQHVVFSIETGFSAIVNVPDIRAFDVQDPIEKEGYGLMVVSIIHAHHPADLDHITRSTSWHFPADSPLLAAIRTACTHLEVPEEEEAAEEGEEEPAGAEG
jgi:hypothetical protein